MSSCNFLSFRASGTTHLVMSCSISFILIGEYLIDSDETDKSSRQNNNVPSNISKRIEKYTDKFT